MRYCPCGFVADAEVAMFSQPWHVAHMEHHLAAFPDVDERTRWNLLDFCKDPLDGSAEV